MEHQAGILRSFLAQLERQEAAGKEAPNGINGEFLTLKSQSTKYRTEKTFPSKIAEKQENIKKNRYKDIVPFDHSRVKLTFLTSKNPSDYINASFIEGVSGASAYIATQGPLPHTVLDFLRMLWEYDVQVVVMACREFEMGKKKCERYWGQNDEQPFVCEPFTVYCDSEENKGDYLTRTLRVTYHNVSRTLKQLHYVTWPDHGVPDSIPPILEMLVEMRSIQAHDNPPIIIHCSAGCGRTGALCVIDYTWNLLKKEMITPDFNIFNLVQHMRTQRPSLVQTKEQYELVYSTIKLLFERYLQSMDPEAHKDEVPSAVTADTESSTSDLRASPRWSHPSHRTPAAEERTLECKDAPLLNPPSSTVAAAICLMVEDPYFDSPKNSPTSEEPAMDSTEQWPDMPSLCLNDKTLELNSSASGTIDTDEETPPPLPLRTPESYVLAVDAEQPLPCERFLVVIPPNAAAEAIRELESNPPSPVPPLPERTPESFELANDQAPVEQKSEATPVVDLSRIGMSSEWCCNSTPAATASLHETKPCSRTRSLKAKMTFTVHEAHPDLASRRISHLSYCLDPLTPPLFLQSEESLTPPLPDRTPESFLLTTHDTHQKTAPCPQPSPRVGMSSEWDGTSQPKTLLDTMKNRSKSVRVKSSRQESLSAVQLHTSPPVVVTEGGSAQVDVSCSPSVTTETPGNKPDKSNEKSTSRTKSFKLFRNKQKPKTAHPSPPTSDGTSPSGFRFGFGNRFGKPKGPRSYPETWV